MGCIYIWGMGVFMWWFRYLLGEDSVVEGMLKI